MRKERSYDFKKVDVCRNCHGRGRIIEVELKPIPPIYRTDAAPQERCIGDVETEVECNVCGGSGRIVKTTHVDITIEPYTGGQI